MYSLYEAANTAETSAYPKQHEVPGLLESALPGYSISEMDLWLYQHPQAIQQMKKVREKMRQMANCEPYWSFKATSYKPETHGNQHTVYVNEKYTHWVSLWPLKEAGRYESAYGGSLLKRIEKASENLFINNPMPALLLD